LAAAPFSVEPVGLRCDYEQEPLGVDSARPRLSWVLEGSGRGADLSAVQVLVASDRDSLARDEADLWDSGKLAQKGTLALPYSGKPLKSAQQVFWKLRVWDEQGRVSDWSKTASWTQGLLAPADWKAAWITSQTTYEATLLRREFEVKPGLRRALVNVCGLGSYELRLNGAKTGTDLIEPGWTNFDRSTLYRSYEVTGQIKEGVNALGLVLGNGMYNVVRKNRFAKFTRSYGPQRAILQLRLEYGDGKTEILATDGTWKVHPGPAVFNSIYGGEDFDARLNPTGWDRAGFDDADWGPAVVCVQRDLATLKGQGASSEPLRAMERRKPVAVTTLPSGKIVYDLGQNASYMISLKVSGPAGSSVRLMPAEVTNPDGSVNRDTMGKIHRGYSWWQYTKATDAEESWFPSFYYVGCRYLQADLIAPGKTEGAKCLPKIEELEGVVVHADVAALGRFACSNELLNRTRNLVRWAQRSNMVSVLTDCPHREKLGWIEQYHLNGPAIRYEFDVSRIFSKGMMDMAESQLESGLVPNVAPYYPDFEGAFLSAAEWGAAFLQVPWQQYLFTGDRRLLETYYAPMKRYVAYLEGCVKDGVLEQGLGDWYDNGPNKPGVAQNTPPAVTATAFLFDDTQTLAKIAALLGKREDAERYAARAAELRRDYNKRFFDAAKGSYATGSQCSNALALVMGIAEQEQRGRVLEALVKDLEKNDYATTAGDIGFRYLLRALADAGRSDLIYRMINQDEKPGYGYQLKKGATSLTEAWDANRGASQNHFMLGQVTEWFYHDLVGIAPDPEQPGFRHILLQPAPVTGLDWAEGEYQSVRGRIALRWERKDGALVVTTTVPAGSSATLRLPVTGGASALKEAGEDLGKSVGVSVEKEEPGVVWLRLSAGSYRFSGKQ
jgi:hypothetical protein